MKKHGETLRVNQKHGSALAMVLVGFVLSVLASSNRSGWLTTIGLAGIALLCFRLAYIQSTPGRLFLELTAEGFAERNPLSTHRYRWQDIRCFLVREGDRGQVVAFRLSDTYHGWISPRFFRDHDLDYDRSLVQEYERSPEELADLLESWRSALRP